MKICILSTYASDEIMAAVEHAEELIRDHGHQVVSCPRLADMIIIDDSLKDCKVAVIRNVIPSKDGINRYTNWDNFMSRMFFDC